MRGRDGRGDHVALLDRLNVEPQALFINFFLKKANLVNENHKGLSTLKC